MELGTLAAEARTSLYALKLDNQMFDIADARMPINPFGDRQARSEGLETAGRRGARDALHRHRHRRVAVRADRIGDLRVLPARRRIGRQGQGRQNALGADRRAAQGRDRAIAAACPEHRDRAPRAGVAVAAPGGGGGARLAAALLRAAASRRVVRAPGTGARPGAAADSRRRRHRLPVVEGHLGRLHHRRSRRPHGGQQVRRHAAAADHVRRAVAAPVHGGRKPAAGRVRDEARGRRRRSRRHRRAPDPRRAPGGGRAHAQRADGRRPGQRRRAADADDRLSNHFRLRARLSRGVRQPGPTASRSSTKWRPTRTRRRC